MCMHTQVFAAEPKNSFEFDELEIVYNNANGELIKSAYGTENLFVTPLTDGSIEFEIPMVKGSHTLVLNTIAGNNRGIFSVYINGEEKTDRINLYNEYIEDKTFVLGSVKLLTDSLVNIRLVSAGRDNNSTAQLGVFKSIEYVDNEEGDQYLSVVKQRIDSVPSVTHPLYNYKSENIMATIYVDSANGSDENLGTLEKPFKTLISAQKKVREINKNMTGDIEVVLRNGIYNEARATRPYNLYDKPINKDVDGETPRELRETIDVTTSQFSLSSEDSASNGYRIVYRAYEGEKPIISGENVISGWELYDKEKNIYRAPSQGIKTRSLYVNGERANRARTEIDTDDFHGLFNNVTVDDNGLVTTDDYFLNWNNIDDVELVFIDPGWWAPRVKIQKAERIEDKTVITLKQPAWYFNRNKNHMSIVKGPAYMENAYELLDKSGEWYLDEDSFYYKPQDGVDINSLNITAGVVEELFRVEGTHDSPVKDISFEGITFRGTTWLRPETDNGFADAQSNGIREDNGSGRYDEMPLAAVTVSWADRIAFKECSFENMGSNGLFIDKGSHDCLILGNNVYDVSGTGIVIGGIGMEYRTVTDEREKIINCDVVSNRITKCAQEYYSGVGISLGMPNDTDVIYNEISDCTYSGMHIGWSFYTEPEMEAMPNLFVNTKIQNNVIFNVCQFLTDGAPIYTRGLTSGPGESPNIISGNYLTGSSNRTMGVYNDSGSRYWLSTNNFAYNTESIMFLNNSDITIAGLNNYGDTLGEYAVSGDKGKVPYMLNINSVLINGGEYPEQVKSIIRNAGLLEEYMYWSDYPIGEIFTIVPKQRRMKLDAGDEAKLEFEAYDIKGNKVDNSGMVYEYTIETYRENTLFIQYKEEKQGLLEMGVNISNPEYGLFIDDENVLSVIGSARGRIFVKGEQNGRKVYTMMSVEPKNTNNVVTQASYIASPGISKTDFMTGDGVYDHLIDFKDGEFIEYTIKTPSTPGEYAMYMWAPGGANRGMFDFYIDGEKLNSEPVDFSLRNQKMFFMKNITTDGEKSMTIRIEYKGKNPESTGTRLAIYGFEFERTANFGDCILLSPGKSNIVINNQKQMVDEENSKVTPIIRNDRTMVPLRVISEGLGCEVIWNADERTAYIPDREIYIKEKESVISSKEGEKQIDSPAFIENDRMYVPIRAITEIFDLDIDWYEEGLVVISDEDKVFSGGENKKLIYKALGVLNNNY